MAIDYTSTYSGVEGSRAKASQQNTEFDLIDTAFDKVELAIGTLNAIFTDSESTTTVTIDPADGIYQEITLSNAGAAITLAVASIGANEVQTIFVVFKESGGADKIITKGTEEAYLLTGGAQTLVQLTYDGSSTWDMKQIHGPDGIWQSASDAGITALNSWVLTALNIKRDKKNKVIHFDGKITHATGTASLTSVMTMPVGYRAINSNVRTTCSGAFGVVINMIFNTDGTVDPYWTSADVSSSTLASIYLTGANHRLA